MKTSYVLIDCENVQVPTISLLKDEQFKVLLFFGPKNHCLKLELVESLQNLNSRPVIVRMGTGGQNALDFRIAYQLGRLVKEDPDGQFEVISKDKGYDPLIQNLQTEHIQVGRSDSIEIFLGLQPANQASSSELGPERRHLTNRMIVNLRGRKGARPATKKTLLGTIRGVCGKELPESTIESIFNNLIEMGIITVSETQIHYSL